MYLPDQDLARSVELLKASLPLSALQKDFPLAELAAGQWYHCHKSTETPDLGVEDLILTLFRN